MRDLVEGVLCGTALQLVLGAPFLWYDTAAYLSRAFELSRSGAPRDLCEG